MKIKIKNSELQEMVAGKQPSFPKYSTQILNLANQNAQGTRPSVVGQMSDLIQEFPGYTMAEWEKWYKEKNLKAIADATDRIYGMVKNLKPVMEVIDREMVEKWVEDLVITKTFIGLKFQSAILNKVADLRNETCSRANPEEESKGIDGYIGEIPVSIKPTTYKLKKSLMEDIAVQIIYYEKKKDGIVIEYDF